MYAVPMLRGQDILVLVRLIGEPPRARIAWIAESLGLGVGPVHRSLASLSKAHLLLEDRRVALAQADEFLVHGLQYVFPPSFGGESRGVPTAWAASPLREKLAESGSQPLVWPHPQGRLRGIALEPLHPVVPDVALRDPELHERLALVDALRLGDARLRRIAREELFARAGKQVAL